MNIVKPFGYILVILLVLGCGVLQSTPKSTMEPPTDVPNISDTVSSGGVKLKVISAIRQDTYAVGTQTFTPNSPLDECLIVEASINDSDTGTVQGWAVSITDENGRKSEPNLTSTKTYTSGKGTTIMWLFVVERTSNSFTVHLPDDQAVDISSLIK
jgi:hypothetical protein